MSSQSMRDEFAAWVDAGCPKKVYPAYLARSNPDWESWVRFLSTFRNSKDTIPENLCDRLNTPFGSTYGEAADAMLGGRGPGPLPNTTPSEGGDQP